MLIILILAVISLAMLCVAILVHKAGKDPTGWVMIGIFIWIGYAACLAAIVSASPSADAMAIKYFIVQSTLNEARSNSQISQFELAAIQQKAVELNAELATKQFWAKSLWTNWFYSKKVLDIALIR
jgi:hypothetical protein